MKGVYKILNKVNGKYYIGSSININKRKISHLNTLRNNKHRNNKLQYAFNKYGENNFEFIILEIIENELDLINLEQYYIDTLKPIYNIIPFADRRVFSEETKQKLSISHIGHKHTEETKKKIGLASKGNKYRVGCKISEEQKNAIRNAKIGNRGRKGIDNPLYGKKRSIELINKVIETKKKIKELKPKCFCGKYTVAKGLCKYHYKKEYRKLKKNENSFQNNN